MIMHQLLVNGFITQFILFVDGQRFEGLLLERAFRSKKSKRLFYLKTEKTRCINW